jgi:hypothetical protein
MIARNLYDNGVSVIDNFVQMRILLYLYEVCAHLLFCGDSFLPVF